MLTKYKEIQFDPLPLLDHQPSFRIISLILNKTYFIMRCLLLLPLFLVISSFTFLQDNIYVEFTNKTTFDELIQTRTQLADKGITLNYRLIEFDAYKKLKALIIEVDCNDGFSGTGTSLQLYNQDKITFKRDYTKDAVVPFEITVGHPK